MGIFKKKKSVTVETDLSQSSLNSQKKQEVRKVYLNYENFSSLKTIQAPPFKTVLNSESNNVESIEYILEVEQDNVSFSGYDIYNVYSKWMAYIVEKDPYCTKLFKKLMESDNNFVHNLFNNYRISLRDVKLADGLFITPFHKKDIILKLSDREILKNMSAIGNLLLKNLVVKEIVTLMEENSHSKGNKGATIFENNKQTDFERQLDSSDDNLNFKDLF